MRIIIEIMSEIRRGNMHFFKELYARRRGARRRRNTRRFLGKADRGIRERRERTK